MSEAPLAARPGSAGPNPETIRFVEKWLWESDTRQTVGQSWTDDYVRDAARMIEDAKRCHPRLVLCRTTTKHQPQKMNELALFAGAGGGILGGKLLGWRTVCAVEIDPWNRDVLLARQRDGILEPFPIWDDVTTFDGKPWRGFVDVVSGGFPCQDISSAGSGEGITGERSGLWGAMARIVGEVLPRFVLVENSPNLTSRGMGTVLGDLAALGYDAKWGVLGARHAGANHARDRIWILANAAGERAHTGKNEGWDYLENMRGQWWANPPDGPVAIDGRFTGAIPLHLGLGDGMAGWMERLKATGNGQVPAVVPLAWKILAQNSGMSDSQSQYPVGSAPPKTEESQ